METQKTKIVTNDSARKARIKAEVSRALKECQAAADIGRNYIYFSTDRDVQREVRDILEEHDVYVPTMFYRGSTPSHKQIEHFGDTSEMKLKWTN